MTPTEFILKIITRRGLILLHTSVHYFVVHTLAYKCRYVSLPTSKFKLVIGINKQMNNEIKTSSDERQTAKLNTKVFLVLVTLNVFEMSKSITLKHSSSNLSTAVTANCFEIVKVTSILFRNNRKPF